MLRKLVQGKNLNIGVLKPFLCPTNTPGIVIVEPRLGRRTYKNIKRSNFYMLATIHDCFSKNVPIA